MDKKRYIVLVLGVLLIALVGLRMYYDRDKKVEDNNKDKEVEVTSDEKAFKEAYEQLNGTKTRNDVEYLTVKIPDKNLVTIKTDTEIVDVLKNGTGVVYFGFNSCPWCRSLVETLINTAIDTGVKNVYYVDVLDIRSSYEVQNNKLTKTKEGSEAYYEILDILKEYLSDYKITDNKKEYNTKEKRLYAPTIVTIKDGEIVGFHEGTVASQTDPYQGLTETEKDELKNILQESFTKIKSASCDGETGC